MRFNPDIDIVFDTPSNKFVGYSVIYQTPVAIEDYDTFCISNTALNSLTDNDNCKFINSSLTTADGFWGWMYNVLFRVIDFDYDTDIWLCKVLGYIE